MKRTPTGWISIIISWMMFLGGLTIGGFYFYADSWKKAAITLVLSVILAIILRLLANIGEFLFAISIRANILDETTNDIFKRIRASDQTLQQILGRAHIAHQAYQEISRQGQLVNKNLHHVSDSIKEAYQEISKQGQLTNKNLHHVSDSIKVADQTLQQINCDSKDMNQNLFKLASFLKEIERGLDLKK